MTSADALFLAVEGPDGAGKTTLARRLATRIRSLGFDVVEVREPGGTRLAEAARAAVLDPALDASPRAELFLLLAARADLIAKVIEPALAAGKVVVTDRFDLSTQAYQVAGRGLEADPVTQANRFATGGRRPDLTLVVDVPAETGLQRQRADGKVPDRMERESATWHTRVAHAFRQAAGPGVVHVDGTGAPDAVERAAWEYVRERLGETPSPVSGSMADEGDRA